MFRETHQVYWVPYRGVLLGRRYRLMVGRRRGTTVSSREYRHFSNAQQHAPVKIVDEAGKRSYWWFEDVFYWDDEGRSGAEVRALMRDRTRLESVPVEHADE